MQVPSPRQVSSRSYAPVPVTALGMHSSLRRAANLIVVETASLVVAEVTGGMLLSGRRTEWSSRDEDSGLRRSMEEVRVAC